MSERERERRRRFDSSRRSAPTSSRTAAGAPVRQVMHRTRSRCSWLRGAVSMTCPTGCRARVRTT